MRNPQPLTRHKRLSFLACRQDACEHELATHRALAERLAALLKCEFVGDADAAAPTADAGYLVPNDTITSLELARRLGLRSEEDLFGGVVPFPFVATKTITHPLVRRDARAPVGWQQAFAQRVSRVVLPGHSAFSFADALEAGERLLRLAPVRIKPAGGIGGAGQSVARDVAELAAQLEALDMDELERQGVVIEANLDEVHTYSVGLLRVGSLLASYVGRQRTTRNAKGEEVYGGSSLSVARGAFDALQRLAAGDEGARRAVALARTYHAAALACFGGMFASRCNYDVVEGLDAQGVLRAGVLEQSWRIGGASGAEVAALQALCDDPSLPTVRASTVEVYGADAVVPDGATVYYRGIDEQVGAITKYALVDDDDADARAEG